MRAIKFLLALLFSIAVAACGGGGGGGTPPVVAGSISGIVTNAANSSGVPGVLVSAGSTSTSTDGTGAYTLSGVSPASSVIVTFAKAGFVPQNRTTTDYTTASSLVSISVPMLAVAHTETFNPTLAQAINVPGSTAQVTLPADGLRTAGGGAPVGQVTAQVTPIAPASNLGTMPGNYLAQTGSTTVPIESFGAINVRFTDASGNALTNLASGQTSTIRIPVSALAGQTVPATIPLFFFNTTTGLWVEEGSANLMGTAPNQYYEGSVTHFSFWNADRVLDTVTATGCVKNVSGTRVAGASVRSKGTNYTGTSSTTTGSDGCFTVGMKKDAAASLQAVMGSVVSEVRLIPATGSTNFTLDTDLVLEPATLTITKAGTGTGTVTASPTGPSYPAGTVVTLTQVPASGSYFAGWTQACVSMGSCVVTMDASKSVTATFRLVDPSTAGGVAQAKAFFSDLRLTLNLFTNGSQTGLLDKQIKRIQNDLIGKTATDLGTFISRAAALDTGATLYQQVMDGSWDDAPYLNTRYVLEAGSVSGTVRVATGGGGGGDACYTNDFSGSAASAVTAGNLAKVTCKVMDWNGSTGGSSMSPGSMTESYILINMTGSVSSMTSTMTYDAQAYSRSSSQTVPSLTSAVYTGSFNSTRDSNYKLTQLVTNGDFPGSQTGITKDSLALTFGANASNANRRDVSGTVTSYDANNTSMAALGISSGSYVDVDANSKPTLVHMVGTAQTTATRFTGTLHMASVVLNADGVNRIPTSVTFTGVISDTSSGGAGDFLTGVLAATVTDYNLYRSSQPESDSNMIKLGATFTGTIGFPNVQVQPIGLVLGLVRTGLTTSSVSVNFTYDNGKSIAGTAVMNSTSPNNAITLTQGSLSVTLGGGSGVVKVMVGDVEVATISGNMIYYVDNTSESLI